MSRVKTKRYLKDGSFIYAWEDTAMRFPNRMLRSVVYMTYPLTDESTSTGFLLKKPCSKFEGRSHAFVVTNRHVVEKEDETTAPTAIKLNTASGKTLSLPFVFADWHLSDENDLAVLPLLGSTEAPGHLLSAVSSNYLLTEELLSEFGVGAGTEVFFTGRFAQHEGSPLNTPVARFGHISLFPETKVENEGVYLIEGLAIKGFSGSPVWAYHRPGNHFKDPKNPTDSAKDMPPRLLGIVKAHWDEGNQKKKKGKKEDKAYNYGMLAVVPAHAISEFIKDKQFDHFLEDDHKDWSKLPTDD